MPLQKIPLDALTKVGQGVKRPEDVVVGKDGRVWLSDADSAAAEALPDGTLRRVGKAGGSPNGINMDLQGRIVIANVGGLDGKGAGPVQRLDVETGKVEVLCAELEGRTLLSSNYPTVDSQGRIWVTHSTFHTSNVFEGEPDGELFRIDPDGTVTKLADGIEFANGCCLDPDEAHIYVCQTTGCNVLRYPINADGSVGAPTPYGPKLGLPASAVQDERPLSPERRGQLGLTDGCGFDQEGNLWVTLPMSNKVVAITPNGDVETIIEDLEGNVMRTPTNVSWGGDDLRDLYVGSITTDYVVNARSPIPGLPLAHQK